MSIADKILLRKRALIETVNDELKNIAQIEHSRHRSFSNFIANSLSAIAAYCFFEKKPAIDVKFVNDGQLAIFWFYFELTLLKYLTDEAKNDFNKFNDNESDLEGNFKAWVYDVICEANIIESIHYVTSPENYREILPEIYLSDFRN